VTKFGWQVDSRIFEIYVKKRLLRFSQLDFVLSEDVLRHGDFLAVSLNKAVGVGILCEVEAINLVRFSVVRSDHSLTRYIEIRRVVDPCDLFWSFVAVEHLVNLI
jgi:hypothetical protein